MPCVHVLLATHAQPLMQMIGDHWHTLSLGKSQEQDDISARGCHGNGTSEALAAVLSDLRQLSIDVVATRAGVGSTTQVYVIACCPVDHVDMGSCASQRRRLLKDGFWQKSSLVSRRDQSSQQGVSVCCRQPYCVCGQAFDQLIQDCMVLFRVCHHIML
ncbi:hypothetical protein LSAT2_032988 [Lamellibrachia satsuma]|nr:hypothetical protein LSAT2_032988 [Lamellibrachia satsuma]